LVPGLSVQDVDVLYETAVVRAQEPLDVQAFIPDSMSSL
jgi:hypothetical protein